MEAYSGLSAHILNHLQPQFLHPGLSFGSGAFRPLGDLKSFPSPSAFAPPKCLKIETNSDVHNQHGHGIFSPSEDRYLGPSPRTDSCSPASASMSPQPQNNIGTVKEESLDAQISEDGDALHGPSTDNDSPGIYEDNRGFRSKSISIIFIIMCQIAHNQKFAITFPYNLNFFKSALNQNCAQKSDILKYIKPILT